MGKSIFEKDNSYKECVEDLYGSLEDYKSQLDKAVDLWYNGKIAPAVYEKLSIMAMYCFLLNKVFTYLQTKKITLDTKDFDREAMDKLIEDAFKEKGEYLDKIFGMY